MDGGIDGASDFTLEAGQPSVNDRVVGQTLNSETKPWIGYVRCAWLRGSGIGKMENEKRQGQPDCGVDEPDCDWIGRREVRARDRRRQAALPG